MCIRDRVGDRGSLSERPPERSSAPCAQRAGAAADRSDGAAGSTARPSGQVCTTDGSRPRAAAD
eukprot:468418-Alexandrium_andersonii.AAC.1